MKTTNWMVWIARILTLLVVAAFAPSAFMKLSHHPMAMEGFAKMGIPGEAILYIGIVELTCLVLFLIPRTSVLGTLLLTGYLGGAILANIINRSDFLHAIVVGILVWAITWIRVPEFRELIPLRNVNRAALASSDGPQSTRAQGPSAALTR